MDYYSKRILFFRRAGIMLACLIAYNIFRLQFTALDEAQNQLYVQRGMVTSIVFGITNIWHDYLFFDFARYVRENPQTPKNRE